jgi:hypothetical protein
VPRSYGMSSNSTSSSLTIHVLPLCCLYDLLHLTQPRNEKACNLDRNIDLPVEKKAGNFSFISSIHLGKAIPIFTLVLNLPDTFHFKLIFKLYHDHEDCIMKYRAVQPFKRLSLTSLAASDGVSQPALNEKVG